MMSSCRGIIICKILYHDEPLENAQMVTLQNILANIRCVEVLRLWHALDQVLFILKVNNGGPADIQCLCRLVWRLREAFRV